MTWRQVGSERLQRCVLFVLHVDTQPFIMDFASERIARFDHHGLHCRDKVQRSRPRHHHQTTFTLGQDASCYLTSHNQVAGATQHLTTLCLCVCVWEWHHHSIPCCFFSVRPFLESHLMEALLSSICRTPAIQLSITVDWTWATATHHATACCRHTPRRFMASKLWLLWVQQYGELKWCVSAFVIRPGWPRCLLISYYSVITAATLSVIFYNAKSISVMETGSRTVKFLGFGCQTAWKKKLLAIFIVRELKK